MQMSYWAAVVITNLFSAIPLVGPSIVEWLWGGFAVRYCAALDSDIELKILLSAGISLDVGYEIMCIPFLSVKMPTT